MHAQNEAYRPSAIVGYYHRTWMILRLRSQWETSLQSNTACHWLGAILESVMIVPCEDDIYKLQMILRWLLWKNNAITHQDGRTRPPGGGGGGGGGYSRYEGYYICFSVSNPLFQVSGIFVEFRPLYLSKNEENVVFWPLYFSKNEENVVFRPLFFIKIGQNV